MLKTLIDNDRSFFMRNKLIYLFLILCFLMLTSFYFRPELLGYDGNLTLYSKSYSSLAKVSDFTFYYTGETLTLTNSSDARKIIEDFKASPVFCYSTESGESTYYYTDKIKVYKVINGKKVNLHIHVENNKATVGSPIIYGSY